MTEIIKLFLDRSVGAGIARLLEQPGDAPQQLVLDEHDADRDRGI
jgi:hypothetical protein